LAYGTMPSSSSAGLNVSTAAVAADTDRLCCCCGCLRACLGPCRGTRHLRALV
jgi:hypothetical protein